jgi:metal-responsive CopG/Arc/MetJ family transcriptional regulator
MQDIENSHLQPAKPVQIRLQRNLFDAIESWRRRQEIIPSRPEAIRRLLSGLLAENTPEHAQGPNDDGHGYHGI